MQTDHKAGRWTLRLDGVFVALAGSAAMITETIGHFFGVGPMAAMFGSPFTIGGFEAHGLAVILAVLLFRAAALGDRRQWHVVGLCTHLLLGTANVMFWNSFVHQGVVVMGYVTTVLHIVFVIAHTACLREGKGNA